MSDKDRERRADNLMRKLSKLPEEDQARMLEFITGNPPGHYKAWVSEQRAQRDAARPRWQRWIIRVVRRLAR